VPETITSNVLSSGFPGDNALENLNLDVRSILKVVGGAGMLTHLSLRLGYRDGFFQSPNSICDVQTISRFMDSVTAGYVSANRYHNSLHAADVMLTANSYLEHSGVLSLHGSSGEALDWRHSRFALLVASAVHDLGHPARMNPFMVASNHPLTLPYAGASGVLEAMHAARFLEVLRQPEHNVLEHLSVDDEQRLRESILELVLATDLNQQFEILGEWLAKKSTVAAQESIGLIPGWNVDFSPSSADRTLFLKVVMKAADVSNPAKPLSQYLFWTNRILEEFYSQGDEEQRLGLPITSMPQCDRSRPSVAGGQKGFMLFVVKPVFEALCGFSTSVQSSLPASSGVQGLESCLETLMSNVAFWKKVEWSVPAEVLAVSCLPSDLPLSNILDDDDLQLTTPLEPPGQILVMPYSSQSLPSDEELVSLDFDIRIVVKVR
jgi:hypothetical protein